MDKPWPELIKEEKHAERLKKYLNPPNVKYKDANAEKTYNERARRLLDVMMCDQWECTRISDGHRNT